MMETRSRVRVAAVLAFAILACEAPAPTELIDLEPPPAPSISFIDSLRHVEDFESGWGAIRVDTSNIAPGEYDFRIRDARFPGAIGNCAWMEMTNANAFSKVWLYAELRGLPNRAYRVEVTSSAGPSGDYAGIATLIGAISVTRPLPRPKGTDFDRQDLLLTPEGGLAFQMIPFAMDEAVTTGADGRIWVAIGFTRHVEAPAGVCVDDIGITVTPAASMLVKRLKA